MSCTVCQHPQCREIDQALINKTATFAALSQQYGLSQTTLHRHKQHLLNKVRQARTSFQANLRLGYLMHLNGFLADAMHVAQVARTEGNVRLLLQSATLGFRLITSMTKFDDVPEQEAVYRLLADSQWAAQETLLPADLRFPHASLPNLAAGLFSHCPESSAQNEAGLAAGDDAAALLAQLDQLQDLFSGLAQSPPPSPQRKNGGKKPENSASKMDDFLQFPAHIDPKNYSADSPRTGSETQPTTAAAHGCHRLETLNPAPETPKWLRFIDSSLLGSGTLPAFNKGQGQSPDPAAFTPAS
jgi:hypothetical protein